MVRTAQDIDKEISLYSGRRTRLRFKNFNRVPDNKECDLLTKKLIELRSIEYVSKDEFIKFKEDFKTIMCCLLNTDEFKDLRLDMLVKICEQLDKYCDEFINKR